MDMNNQSTLTAVKTPTLLKRLQAASGDTQYGLLSGQIGSAILYYLLSKHTSDETLKEEGLALLDEISENITSIQKLGFGDGLAGIGWGVEWLVQNELLADTNTDDVLEDVDNTLYKAVIYTREKDTSLLTGMLGSIAYFLRRELSRNPGTHRFRRICHQECIVILTDCLYETLTGDNGLLKDTPGSAAENNFIINLGQTLTLMSSIIDINRPTVKAILRESVKYAGEVLTGAVSLEPPSRSLNEHLNALYLAVCMLIAGKKRQDNLLQSQAIEYIGKLYAALPGDVLSDQQLQLKKLSVLILLYVNLPENEYKDEIEKLVRSLSAEDLPFLLYNGAGTLMLAEICLSDPLLIEDWHELIFLK